MLVYHAKAESVLSVVMICSVGIQESTQKVLTQIRLLLKEQSDQGLHFLSSLQLYFTQGMMVKSTSLN